MSLINLIDFDSAQIFDENGREIDLVHLNHDEERIDLAIKFRMLLNIGDDSTVDIDVTPTLRIPASKLFLNDLKISAYDLAIDDYKFEILSDSVITEELAYQYIESGQADELIFDLSFRFEANVTQ